MRGFSEARDQVWFLLCPWRPITEPGHSVCKCLREASREATPTVFSGSSMALTKSQASRVQDRTVSVLPSRNKRVMADW